MNSTIWRRVDFVQFALMALMALTRLGHFGTSFSLPDASLAVFFLAGTGTFSFWFFSVLLLEAGVVDYIAIKHLGISGFCVTSAYVWLVLSYLVMWLAGDYCKGFFRLNLGNIMKALLLAFLATTAAYLVSNGSFYLFSDYFGELSWHEYWQQMLRYYGAYCIPALIYIAIGLTAGRIWQKAQTTFFAES